MSRPVVFLLASLFLASFTCVFPGVTSSVLRIAPNSPSEVHDYRRAHSLDDSYDFHPRDGWTTLDVRATLNTTTLQQDGSAAGERRSEKEDKSSVKDKRKSVASVSQVLKAVGDAISVMITWYTGHDLDNPSCWKSTDWTPTDKSFICALTLTGWKTKPECFEFLELCVGSKCIFVRVVDTCAGCAAGSQHVDLTKAAFTELAPLDVGMVSTVKMRRASTPAAADWVEALWGPRV